MGICLGNAISLCYSVFVFVSYYVHSIGLVSLAFSFVVSLGFSPILSLVLSLILSVLQCLIPAFFSSFYPSSESVYCPPRHVCHLVLSIEFVVLSSHPGSRHCRSRFRICTSRFVSLDSSHQVSSVLGSRFPAFGFVFCYHVPVFCDFVVKSVSHCLCFSSCCCCLVFKSWCLVSWYGCMFCGILYCFGFNWILVWSGHWKAKFCFKEGKGRSQLLYQLSLGHGKLLSCSGSLNPPSNPPSQKILVGSVSVRLVSHTVICLLSCRNVRSPSLGLKSESISRLFTVRGRVPRLSIKSLLYESLPPLHSRISAILSRFWLAARKFWFEFWKSESWKHYAIANFIFSVSDFVLKGGGV